MRVLDYHPGMGLLLEKVGGKGSFYLAAVTMDEGEAQWL